MSYQENSIIVVEKRDYIPPLELNLYFVNLFTNSAYEVFSFDSEKAEM